MKPGMEQVTGNRSGLTRALPLAVRSTLASDGDGFGDTLELLGGGGEATGQPRPRPAGPRPGGRASATTTGVRSRRERGGSSRLQLTHKKITIKVQSWIVNYFHNRIVGNYCTFPGPLTFGIIRVVPTNYNGVL